MHFETLQPEHLPLLQDWLRRDYARFWGMGHMSLTQLADYVDEIQRSSHRDIALGLWNGDPAFLFEGYTRPRPASPTTIRCAPAIAACTCCSPLRAPGARLQPGGDAQHPRLSVRRPSPAASSSSPTPATPRYMRSTAGSASSTSACCICRRRTPAWRSAPVRSSSPPFRRTRNESARTPADRYQRPGHRPSASRTWACANRLLLKKALAEFSHEKLLSPEPLGDSHYRVAVPDSSTEYRFKARRLALDHWSIATDSIEKLSDGEPQPLDALAFIIEFSDVLGLSETNLPLYLDEISSTLFGSAYNSPTAR